ncbi:MAG: hypothetical protein VYE22_05205 [Myxococcota bacterium]|nr:hypothetical protein [Myxococcota bacterium]
MRTTMRNGSWIVALALTGCTFGISDQVSFATRNLEIEGDVGDGAFEIEGGTVNLVAAGDTLENGVEIFVDGAASGTAISSALRFTGNLGALCPGARVELGRVGDRLEPMDVRGAPPEMATQLSLLSLTSETVASSESGTNVLVPTRVVVSSAAGREGFSRMTFESTTVVDGESRVVRGSFDVARVVEPAETPGWSGESWNGQPIDPWE